MLSVKLVDDEDTVRSIKQAIKENDGFCPCRLEHTPSTKCPCAEFRNQIKKGIEGECHCGLYVAYNNGSDSGS